MIQTRLVESIEPDLVNHLRAFGAVEFTKAGNWRKDVEWRSHTMWRADLWDGTPLAQFGLYKPDQLGPHFFWLLLCEGFTARYLREALSGLKEILAPFHLVQTQVNENFLVGRRFAELGGFKPTALVVPVLGQPHRIYEARF